ETATDVYHLSMEYQDGQLRFFGGKVDANDGVQNGTNAIVGSRYVTDAGYPVTGSLGNGQITLAIPLSALGLGLGDKIVNVSAFATAAPAESDPTAGIVTNSARTVDATPPFDATLQKYADVGVTIADSPDPVKRTKPLTYTIRVSNGGPSDATAVSLTD